MHKISMNLPDPIWEYLQKAAQEEDVPMTYIVIESIKMRQKDVHNNSEDKNEH